MGAFEIAGGVLGLVAFFTLVGVLKAFIKVCPPNYVLVVTGTRTKVQGRDYGFRLQRTGWTFVVPYFQNVQVLDLSIIPISVRVDGVNAANGITVGADASACVCVDHNDETLLYSAVERLMGKSLDEIQEQIQQMMVGNFRGALNKTTPLQAIGMVESVDEEDRVGEGTSLVEVAAREGHPAEVDAEGERAQFRAGLLQDSNQDLSTFGMRVVSVSLQKIWDTSNYIANLANKTLSRKRQEVEIQEARLSARAAQAESDSKRRQAVAESRARERIIAAEQELEVYRRQCNAQIQRVELEANNAISQAESEGEQTVQAVFVDLQKLRNVSTVTLEAEAKRQAAETLAEGEGNAVRVLRGTRNDLLEQKARLVAESGDSAKVALFVQQQLGHLFESYEEYAKDLRLDSVVIMDDERGINAVVNRGPDAFVDYLRLFEQALGIRVRDLLSGPLDHEEARS